MKRFGIAALSIVVASCTSTPRRVVEPAAVRQRPATPCAETVAIAQRREAAVRRGIEWMAAYLAPDDRVRTMGTDGAQIFLELALTSEWPSVRGRALEIARTNAARIVPRYLASDGIHDAWDFADALDLLVDAEPLGLDAAGLSTVVNARFAQFAHDEDAYGIPIANGDALTDEQAFNLLLEAYTFERAAIAFPGRFPVRFGLADALRIAWTRPLASWAASGPSADRGSESAYLATHVPLVLTEYGRHPLPRDSVSHFVDFLVAEFPAYLAARDVEIVGETADVFRQMGRTDGSHAQLCAATRFLLASQNSDGSWGDWARANTPYNAVHKTWAAVTGLVERAQGSDAPYAQHIATILTHLTMDVAGSGSGRGRDFTVRPEQAAARNERSGVEGRSVHDGPQTRADATR